LGHCQNEEDVSDMTIGTAQVIILDDELVRMAQDIHAAIAMLESKCIYQIEPIRAQEPGFFTQLNSDRG
jgi:hypothetical protein